MIYDARGQLIKTTMVTKEESQVPEVSGELGADSQDNLSGTFAQIIVTNARIKNLTADKIETGTLGVNTRIIVNDGDDDRIVIGDLNF